VSGGEDMIYLLENAENEMKQDNLRGNATYNT
jgi:hypothetical protein